MKLIRLITRSIQILISGVEVTEILSKVLALTRRVLVIFLFSFEFIAISLKVRPELR